MKVNSFSSFQMHPLVFSSSLLNCYTFSKHQDFTVFFDIIARLLFKVIFHRKTTFSVSIIHTKMSSIEEYFFSFQHYSPDKQIFFQNASCSLLADFAGSLRKYSFKISKHLKTSLQKSQRLPSLLHHVVGSKLLKQLFG